MPRSKKIKKRLQKNIMGVKRNLSQKEFILSKMNKVKQNQNYIHDLVSEQSLINCFVKKLTLEILSANLQ